MSSAVRDDGSPQLSSPKYYEIADRPAFANAFEAAHKSLPSSVRNAVSRELKLGSSPRLFTTRDGLAGFCLDGNNITSTFNHANSEHQGSVPAMLQLATELGGQRVAIPDRELADAFALSGFRVAARTKGEHGQPDTLHIVFDPQHHGRFNANEGVTVNSPEEARQAQDQMLQEIANRPKNPHRFDIDAYHIARQNPNQFSSYDDVNAAVRAALHPDYYFGGGKQMGEQRNVLPLGQDRYLSVIHSTKGNSTKVHEVHVISRSDLDQLRQR